MKRRRFAAKAASRVWARTATIAETIARYRQDQRRLHTPTHFHIIADQLPTDRFVEVSIAILTRLSGSVRDLPRHCAPPIVRRLREDIQAREGYLQHLRGEPGANAKASIPGLLVAAAGLTEDLRDWSTGELAQQCQADGMSQHGVDLIAGGVRPVAHALLDLFGSRDR